MIEPCPLPQPPGNQVVVQGDPQWLRITLLPRATAVARRHRVVCRLAGLIGLGLVCLVVFVRHDPGLAVTLLTAGLGLLVSAGYLAIDGRRFRRSVLVEVSSRRLWLTVPGVILRQRYQWRREEIRAIGAWGKLWVVTSHEWEGVLGERSGAELEWLAEVLRHILHVPEKPSPRVDEIAVYFQVGLEGTAQPGLLRAKPGWMVIQHAFAVYPRYLVRLAPHGRSWLTRALADGTLLIAPWELGCRVWEDGTASAHIAPSGTGFSLAVWCEDKDAFEDALGRFWDRKDEA